MPEPPESQDSALIHARGLTKRYAGLTAVDHIDSYGLNVLLNLVDKEKGY